MRYRFHVGTDIR